MATRTSTAPVPRETLATRIAALDLPQARSYADFIRTGDPDGPVPCWGAIKERFQQEFKPAADRKALWNVLLDEGDRRPLLLFLDANRDRPEVMAKVLEDAGRLPPALQRALVSFAEVADRLPAHLDKLDPAARQVFEAGPEAIAAEREQVEARIAQLTTFRYFVPDRVDPAKEQGAGATTVSGSAVAVEPNVAGTTGGGP